MKFYRRDWVTQSNILVVKNDKGEEGGLQERGAYYRGGAYFRGEA